MLYGCHNKKLKRWQINLLEGPVISYSDRLSSQKKMSFQRKRKTGITAVLLYQAALHTVMQCHTLKDQVARNQTRSDVYCITNKSRLMARVESITFQHADAKIKFDKINTEFYFIK